MSTQMPEWPNWSREKKGRRVMQCVEVNAVVWLGACTLSFHMSSRG